MIIKNLIIQNFYALIITQAWGLIFGPLILLVPFFGYNKLGPEISSGFIIFAIILIIYSLIDFYTFKKEEHYFGENQNNRFSNKDRVKYTEADKLEIYNSDDDYFHNKYFTEVYELDVDDDELIVREVEEYQWDIRNAELVKNRFYYFEICRSSRIEYYIVDTLNVKVNINFKKASQYEIYKITKLGTRIYI